MSQLCPTCGFALFNYQPGHSLTCKHGHKWLLDGAPATPASLEPYVPPQPLILNESVLPDEPAPEPEVVTVTVPVLSRQLCVLLFVAGVAADALVRLVA